MQTMLSVMKALADLNRLRVVAVLQVHAELCACQITELLQVTGATVSRHMTILVKAGLVESRKEGRWTYFRLKTTPPADSGSILKWLREGAEQSDQGARDRKALTKILSLEKAELCRQQRGEACCPLPGRTHLTLNDQPKEN